MLDLDGVRKDLAAPFVRWRVWFLLANQDIGLRYRRSWLGPIWISLAMASLILGLSVLYSEVFGVEFQDYIVYVGCGFLAWFLIAGLVNEGAGAIIESEAKLRALPLPIPLLVAQVVYRNLIAFAHNLVVVGIMLLIFGFRPGPEALLAVPALVLYTLCGFFVGILLAPLSARFRDIPQVLANVMQIMFFLTPLFWLPSQTSSRPYLVHGNPFYHLVQLIRGPLLGETPDPMSWAVALGVTAALGIGAVLSLIIARKRVFLWL